MSSSSQVGKFIQFISTFLGGFIIAFCRGWLLALVLCTCIPFLVAAGATAAILMAKMATRGQLAYAGAGNIVEQTVGAIRTVKKKKKPSVRIVFLGLNILLLKGKLVPNSCRYNPTLVRRLRSRSTKANCTLLIRLV